MSRRPPYTDLYPTVEWQLNGRCNYDCSYCIQSRRSRVGVPDAERVRAIIEGFARLDGQWEIKISGGEPFAFDGLLKWVVPQLMAQTPHSLSILTNFSAPLSALERFCRASGDRLRITSASLHLEFEQLERFVEKAIAYRELRSRYNPRSSFVVNSVLVPGRLEGQRATKERLQGEGFRYFPQLMKINGGVYPYSPSDRRLVEELCEGKLDAFSANRAPSYEGLWCEAGVWYFVVDQRGDAYSCRTAKRFADGPDDEAYLGSLADGTFRLRADGGPCPYSICPCTVPANRGIVRLAGREVGNG